MGTFAAVSKFADRLALVLFGVQTINAYGSNENAPRADLKTWSHMSDGRSYAAAEIFAPGVRSAPTPFHRT